MKITSTETSERQRKAAEKAWKTIRATAADVKRAGAALDACETIREERAN
jgi:hypothetical protein